MSFLSPGISLTALTPLILLLLLLLLLLRYDTNRVTVGRNIEEFGCQQLVFRATVYVISSCSYFVVSWAFGTSMPRTSEKQQYMRRMYSYMGERIVARLFRTVVEDDDSVEDVKDAAFAP